MDRIRFCAAVAPALMLLACGQTQTSREETGSKPGTAPTAIEGDPAAKGTEPRAPAPDRGAPAAKDESPDPASRLTPEAERGAEGARDILLSFARAIERKEYGKAWAMLSPSDQRKWSKTEFAGIFSDLVGVSIAIPAGRMEGAAGSSYYSAPVTISGSDRTGRPVRIEGQAVLRRVNDVDGASPAQLHWHFETLSLDWTH